MAKDYYDVLGLKKGASIDEIKSAYKELAKKFHPDVSKEQNAEEKFKEVQEAYSVLSDPQKKENYDRFGSSFEQFGGFGPGTGFGGFDFRGGDFGFEDLFQGFGGFEDIFDVFSGRKTKRGPRRGNDLQFSLNISFEEAVFGVEKTIEVSRIDSCESCHGSGAEKDSKKKVCRECNGSGIKETVKKTMFGVFSTRTTCPVCKGEKELIENPCKKCNGLGIIKVKRKISLKIPEGIDNGNSLRLHGEGNAGERGGQNGDLFVVIFVEPHDVFKRDGLDLFSEVPLSFSEAVLGAEIELPTIRGKAKLNIPSATQTSTIFKLKGQGVKSLDRERIGDQFVKVIIQTPKHLTKRQKELFEELAKEDETKTQRKGFFDSIKKAFKGH